MWPGLIASPSTASAAGRLATRDRCCARMVVKVGGICWVMRIGSCRLAGNAPSTVNRACGPPVELPMAITEGGTREGVRITIGPGVVLVLLTGGRNGRSLLAAGEAAPARWRAPRR